MGNRNFTELEIWQEGKALAVDVFKFWQSIDNRGYFALQDQMQRAAVSISSNIAEGSERNTSKDYIRFLYMAKASSAELRTQLYILSEINICAEQGLLKRLIENSEILSRRIQRLISVISEGGNK